MNCAIVIDEQVFIGIDQPEIKVQLPRVNDLIIKHISKSARIACANLLIYILKLIKYDTNDVTACVLLLHFTRKLLAKPHQTGHFNSLSSNIEKRITIYLLPKSGIIRA